MLPEISVEVVPSSVKQNCKATERTTYDALVPIFLLLIKTKLYRKNEQERNI